MISRKDKDGSGHRRFAQLNVEGDRLFAQKHKRLKAKYGECAFPEIMELIEKLRKRERRQTAPGDYAVGLPDLEREQTNRLICAEMEKIIWGETTAETAAGIDEIEREIEELLRTAREERE